MRLQAFKVIASVLSVAALAVACGGNGSPANPPTGLKVEAFESSVRVSYDAVSGVDYWLFYAPTIYAPKDNSNMNKWFGLLGGNVVLNVTQPYILSGLLNGTSYSFTVNGRTGGGPGGAAANTVTVTPRLAGGVWTSTTPITTQDLRAVALGTNVVAVGTGGTILSSSTLPTWTAVTSPTTKTLNGAVYTLTSNGSTVTSMGYLAVGEAGTILQSADAVTWTTKTSGTTQDLYATAYSTVGQNVTVGAGGTILYSADSVTWNTATSGTSQTLYAVAYYGSTWYAAGAGGTLLKSTDGIAWTAVPTGSTADIHGMAFGATTDTTVTSGVAYVLVGSGGTVLTSPDAVTWTSKTLAGSGTLNAVTYGTQFVLLGQGTGSGGKIYNSTDGVAWTDVTPAGLTSNPLTVLRGSSMYLVMGTAGSTLTSY